MAGNPRLLYFSPIVSGGLADYARAQADALGRLGIDVEMLSSDQFPKRPGDAYRMREDLVEVKPSSNPFIRRGQRVRKIVADYGRLARVIDQTGYKHVLLGSYAEYLAPLWAGPLSEFAMRGMVCGANIHDPVRDHQVGPLWWHRRSIAAAYSFLREAFVHEPIVLDTVQRFPRLRTTVVPHGPYEFPPAASTREEARRKLSLPETAPVWLSFGHIRDGKNLDLIIRALAEFPEAYLLVAGKEQSSGQKPVAFYQDLARECGVAARCVWLNRFIGPEEVGDLFTASDLVLLTYSSDFRSASGVLNAAVNFRKPCLASSGQGSLQTMVARYNLGTWVEPDRLDALMAGLRQAQASPPTPRWEDYAAENSWARNAEIVRDRMFTLN